MHNNTAYVTYGVVARNIYKVWQSSAVLFRGLIWFFMQSLDKIIIIFSIGCIEFGSSAIMQ